ncbi:MAG: Uma2 family endonuclease, partial [Limnospira sp. PMC 894.15]|nr:Uma2 family endonuclease [Limnospira sp. PMC 894.15]
DNLVLYRPDGQPFADYLEAQQQLTTMTEQLEQERQAKQAATEQLEQERQRNQRLEQLLREAGLNPDANL